jgi:hypothetical protein
VARSPATIDGRDRRAPSFRVRKSMAPVVAP